MSHRITNTNSTRPSIWPRLAVWLMAACLVAAAGVGCDGQEVTPPDNVEENDNQNQESNQEHNHNSENNVHEHDDEYYEAHGPDDDEELLDVGTMQGSWRSAFVDGDVPLAYFDIFHDEGQSTADGDFLMGIAISDMQDGNTGSLETVSIDGENVEVHWNPTDDMEEMYILELVRQDEDTYTGTFRGERYPDEHQVELTRRHIE